MDRRTASGVLLATTGSLVAAGVVGVPALVSALSPAFAGRASTWRSVGRLQDFPIGEVTEAAIAVDPHQWPRGIREQNVFVWRRSEQEIIVFSRSCTDLGCPLDYEPGSGCYLCPCHGGIFAQDGRRLAGPPKSAMHRYEHRVRENVLEVDTASIPPAA